MIKLSIENKVWKLFKEFNISRGSKTKAETVEVKLSMNDEVGLGECVPYSRYNETVNSVKDQIESVREGIELGKINLDNLSLNMLPGAARNAVDCALWDLKCKLEGSTIWTILDQPKPKAIPSCYTIVLDNPEKMILDAKKHSNFPLLKIKVDKDDLATILTGIRNISPKAKIILDANESFDFKILHSHMDLFIETGIDLIEQPLPANNDDQLIEYKSPIPICADESFHTIEDLDQVMNKYDSINIKLDKTGGLSEAIQIKRKAAEHNKIIMVGCMVSSSLSMLPALTLCNNIDFVDLDGPCFLEKDRQGGLVYKNGLIEMNDISCWG